VLQVLGRPVKRSHQSTQRELQTKKQKPNAQKPNINNSKNQNQKGNNQKQKVWVPMKSCIYFTKGFCKDVSDDSVFQCNLKLNYSFIRVINVLLSMMLHL
jgi:hypothetical protein